MKCPLPIDHLSRIVDEISAGSECTVVADDPAFTTQLQSWCDQTGHTLVNWCAESGRAEVTVRKAA